MIEKCYIKKIKFNKEDFTNNNLKPQCLLKMFQNIAIEHSEVIGVGAKRMLEQFSAFWIVSRIKFEMLGKLEPDVEYGLETFTEPKKLIDFNRDFAIYNKKGDMLVRAISKWCLVDINARKLLKLKNVGESTEYDKPSLFEGSFLKTDKFEIPVKPNYIYRVNENDIDTNNHLNNTQYAKIISNILDNKNIQFLQINYIKEALLNDNILIYLNQKNEDIFLQGSFENGQVCFTAQVKII